MNQIASWTVRRGVRDFESELIFEGQHQLNALKAVGAKDQSRNGYARSHRLRRLQGVQ